MPPRRSTQGVRHQSPSPGPQAVRPQVPDISGGRTHRSYHCAGAGWVLRMSGGQGRSDAAGRWGGRCGRPSPSHGRLLGPELGHTWAHVVTVTLTRRTRGPLLAGGPAGCTQDLLPLGEADTGSQGAKREAPSSWASHHPACVGAPCQLGARLWPRPGPENAPWGPPGRDVPVRAQAREEGGGKAAPTLTPTGGGGRGRPRGTVTFSQEIL